VPLEQFLEEKITVEKQW